jgi:hypothetical protein
MGIRHRGKSQGESEKALAEAQEKLSEVRERGEEVTTVASSLRNFRVENHISAQLEDIIMRRYRGTS